MSKSRPKSSAVPLDTKTDEKGPRTRKTKTKSDAGGAEMIESQQQHRNDTNGSKMEPQKDTGVESWVDLKDLEGHDSRYPLRRKKALIDQHEVASAKKSKIASPHRAAEPKKTKRSPKSSSSGTKQGPRNAKQPDQHTPQTGQSERTTTRMNTQAVSPVPKSPVTKKRQRGKNTSLGVKTVPDQLIQKDTHIKSENACETNGCVKKASKKLVGAHCSIAGGLYKSVEEAVAMDARAFGLFLRSQRTWASKPLDPEAAEKFKASCKEHGFPPHSILPHGSYLMNCGSPNPETLQKSRDALVEELKRCEALGLTLYNFHPGSTCGEISISESLDKIAESINLAHSQTKFVTTVIENMCCQGSTIGGRFEELKGIIDRVKDKTRIGVCLDTCHAFAAGFDISTKEGFEKFMSDFDSIVGFHFLRAMHLNDSKGGVGCHLDRHENIGKGQIGLDGFQRIMQDPRFDNIPMILETPLGDYAKEIKLLNKLA